MSSVGWCYRGVKRALKKIGVALEGSSAFMAKSQLASDRRFTKVSIKSLKTGDILVHGASKAHPNGHIAVYLGNGKEASDHIGRLITGTRYGGTTVFRARGGDQVAVSQVVSASRTMKIAHAPVVQASRTVKIAHAPHVSKSAARLIARVPAIMKPSPDAMDHAVKVAHARIEQHAKQQEAVAHAVQVAKPMSPKSPSFDLSNALTTKVLPMAQNAQINLSAALANAFPQVIEAMEID